MLPRELVAIDEEWQEVELRSVNPNVRLSEVVHTWSFGKGLFLPFFLFKPRLQVLPFEGWITLEELVEVNLSVFICHTESIYHCASER